MRARATRGLRRIWWWFRDHWPFSYLIDVIKALPLLGAWCVVAGASFYIFQWLLYFLGVPPTGDKETIALVSAFLAGLIGFGVQQWRILTEEETRERQRAYEEAKQEISTLPILLRNDPSEGARRYVQLADRWAIQSAQLCMMLDDVRQTFAPAELRDAIELLRLSPEDMRFAEIAQKDPARNVAALEWVYEHLDDDWRNRAWFGLARLGRDNKCREHIRHIEDVEQRCWRAVLRPWSHIALWRDHPPCPPPADPALAKGLRYLGLARELFGPAEVDISLLTCRVDPPWLADLCQPQPALFVGASNSGKTATALLVVYDNLRHKSPAFPVYYPAMPCVFKPGDIAQAVAVTLLCYLAVRPADFLKCTTAQKSTIACLLARYAGPGWTFRLRLAGLPLAGEGAQMQQEIEALVQDHTFQEPLPDDELLALLSEARPHGFQYTSILLDVQKPRDEGAKEELDAYLSSLLDLVDVLARGGIYIKAFLPHVSQKRRILHKWNDRLLVEPVQPRWSDDKLATLLERRLNWAGVDALSNWCDPGTKDLLPNERLVRAAQGKLDDLVHRLNDLVRCVGRKQSLLTKHDLDKILGSAPDRGIL